VGDFLTDVFEVFEREKIRYCVLRNYLGLPDDPGNDVDVLVHGDDAKRATIVLDHVAARNDWVLARRVMRFQYFGSLYFRRESGQTILFDLYTGVSYKGIPSGNAEFILESCVSYRGIRVASQGCEAAVTLFKELLMFGWVKRDDAVRMRLAECVGADPHGFRQALDGLLELETILRVSGLAGDGRWESIEILHQEIRHELVARSLRRGLVRQVRAWARFLGYHLLLRFRGNAGFFVAVIGPDGVGKTTLLEAVVSVFGKGVFKDRISIHKDFGILPQLKVLKRILPAKDRFSPNVAASLDTLSGMTKPHSIWMAVVYSTYYFFDFLLGHIVISRAKGRECLIVADRYFYDYFFQHTYRNTPWFLLKFMARFIPKPDLLLSLSADPMTVQNRKQELTVDEIRRQLGVTENISIMFPFVLKVMTDRPLDECTAAIRNRILVMMSSRQLRPSILLPRASSTR